MKKIKQLLITAGLLALSNLVYAVDCNAVRAKYSCPADTKYPLHLSFDDGPALQTTDVLDALRREKVPATFFVLAEKIDCGRILQQCVKDNPDTAADGSNCVEYRQCELRRTILNKAKQDGHMIGSHSYSHLRYSMLPPRLMQRHFSASRRLLEPFFTTEPALFRLPYGDGWFNRKEKAYVLKELAQQNFLHVDWQLSAFDWDTRNQQGDKIMDKVLGQICHRKNGGIVLFHDGVDNQMHEGRLFTTQNIGRWIPMMRCAVEFKPLEDVLKGFKKR
ncbi:MAG: polysaccharide deacetylase family protein [Thiolinea sp.]